MFTDPTPITVNGVLTNLARVLMSGFSATYQTADELLKLINSHTVQNNGRVKHLVRLEQRKVVTNPVDSSQSDYDFCGVSIQIDRPSYGFSATEVDYLVAALKAHLTTAVVTKLYGKES